jgi:hypothetical protein
MRYLLLCILFVVCSVPITAQKHDYIWPGGEYIINSPYTGGFLLNFNTLSPVVSSHPRELNLFHSCASICDTSGNLMAYTNGCDIASGINDEILDNGADINPGYVNEYQCHSTNGVGSYTAGIQSSVFLPLPDTVGIYYLFHKRIKYSYNPFDVFTDILLYSVVDMNAMGGQGRVIQKNVPLMEDSLSYGMLTAVKHANGKDWWIITNRRKEDDYYCFLLTKEGIKDTVFQQIGFDFGPNQEGSCQITFTPDGSKFITCNPYAGLGIFEFDRSTGLLSNYQTIDIKPYIWKWTDFTGCAVSPNNRFVYVSSTLDLLQYDLSAPDIAASRVNVGVYDGGQNPLATTFAQCHLAPDCKIYIQTGQQAKSMHVIHSPNEQGTGCNFEQRGLALTNANRGSLPYFPHFRLGPLDNPGEPCTTVVSTTAPPTPLPGFSVFPNPAVDHLRILPNRLYKGEGVFRLYTGTGTLVREVVFDPLSAATTTVAVEDLLSGIYFYQVWCEGRMVRADKVIIQH